MALSICCPGGDCDPAPSTGVCVWCEHVTCTGCDQVVPAERSHEVYWVPGEYAPGRLCTTCVEEDSDGVPEEVEEAATVRERVSTSDVAAHWKGIIESRRAAA